MTCDSCLYSEKDVYFKGLSNAIGLVSIGPGIKKLIFCMGRAKTAKTRGVFANLPTEGGGPHTK